MSRTQCFWFGKAIFQIKYYEYVSYILLGINVHSKNQQVYFSIGTENVAHMRKDSNIDYIIILKQIVAQCSLCYQYCPLLENNFYRILVYVFH